MRYIPILCIQTYQWIKKILLWGGIIKPSCKFYPTCSEYMILAIKKYGIIIGIGNGINRIRRCTPNSEHSVDNP
jgi:uncharacterized protein